MTIRALFTALPLVLGVACGDNGSDQPKDAPVEPDAGTPDASCFEISGVPNPSHEQIINACTPPTVQKIYKDTHPPLINADGTLPPLPP